MRQRSRRTGEATPATGKGAKLRITRGSAFADSLRAYKIKIDGKAIGSIKRKNTVTFPVSPGSHEIMLSIDWCRSNTVGIDIRDGETLDMECGSSLSGWRIFFATYYVMFRPNRYLWLRMAATP
jgi:hypothetical protein